MLAPGGGKVPPDGLDQFRLATLGVAAGDNPTVYGLFSSFFSNVAILGSRDAVP